MSASFQLAELERWTKGTTLQGTPTQVFCGVGIDSRNIAAGQLFVAIRGPHHDAHSYLEMAIDQGATGLLIERKRAPRGVSDAKVIVEVDDTTRALGELAAGHRAKFKGPLIAITGSCGKTTTKELCAAILKELGPCLYTRGNLNNQFGLPLTLLGREDADRYAVVELGTNHPGEIAPLAAIAKPQVAIVTNVGSAHIEFFGSEAAIAEEKASLLDALPGDGVAVLNADDAHRAAVSAHAPGRILRFGRAKNAEFRATNERRTAEGFRFQLTTPRGSRCVEVPGASPTLIPNFLAAAAAAFAVGASLDQIERGLRNYRGIAGRMQMRTLASGTKLIDDTYNANPQAMCAALETLAAIAKAEKRRPIAVLGDMGELGSFAAKAHQEVGQCAAKVGVARLIGVGQHAGELAEGARRAGLAAEQIAETASAAEAAATLTEDLDPNDMVLLKGSRSVGMERVIEILEGERA